MDDKIAINLKLAIDVETKAVVSKPWFHITECGTVIYDPQALWSMLLVENNTRVPYTWFMFII